jgi:hypothetical protein
MGRTGTGRSSMKISTKHRICRTGVALTCLVVLVYAWINGIGYVIEHLGSVGYYLGYAFLFVPAVVVPLLYFGEDFDIFRDENTFLLVIMATFIAGLIDMIGVFYSLLPPERTIPTDCTPFYNASYAIILSTAFIALYEFVGKKACKIIWK